MMVRKFQLINEGQYTCLSLYMSSGRLKTYKILMRKKTFMNQLIQLKALHITFM